MNKIDERYRNYYYFNEGVEWLGKCLKETVPLTSLIEPILRGDLSLWCQNPDPVLGRKANEEWGPERRGIPVITMFRLEFQHWITFGCRGGTLLSGAEIRMDSCFRPH